MASSSKTPTVRYTGTYHFAGTNVKAPASIRALYVRLRDNFKFIGGTLYVRNLEFKADTRPNNGQTSQGDLLSLDVNSLISLAQKNPTAQTLADLLKPDLKKKPAAVAERRWLKATDDQLKAYERDQLKVKVANIKAQIVAGKRSLSYTERQQKAWQAGIQRLSRSRVKILVKLEADELLLKSLTES